MDKNMQQGGAPLWLSRLWIRVVTAGLGYCCATDSMAGPRNFHMPWEWLKKKKYMPGGSCGLERTQG